MNAFGRRDVYGKSRMAFIFVSFFLSLILEQELRTTPQNLRTQSFVSQHRSTSKATRPDAHIVDSNSSFVVEFASLALHFLRLGYPLPHSIVSVDDESGWRQGGWEWRKTLRKRRNGGCWCTIAVLYILSRKRGRADCVRIIETLRSWSGD